MMTFELSLEQLKKFNTWDNEHKKVCRLRKLTTAIGGRLTYSFKPTSLGTVIKVTCVCGENCDLTDVGDW